MVSWTCFMVVSSESVQEVWTSWSSIMSAATAVAFIRRLMLELHEHIGNTILQYNKSQQRQKYCNTDDVTDVCVVCRSVCHADRCATPRWPVGMSNIHTSKRDNALSLCLCDSQMQQGRTQGNFHCGSGNMPSWKSVMTQCLTSTKRHNNIIISSM